MQITGDDLDTRRHRSPLRIAHQRLHPVPLGKERSQRMAAGESGRSGDGNRPVHAYCTSGL